MWHDLTQSHDLLQRRLTWHPMPDQIASHHGSGAPNPPGTMDVDALPHGQRCIDGIEDPRHHDSGRNIPIADGQPLVRGGIRSRRDSSHEEGEIGYVLVGFGQIYSR